MLSPWASPHPLHPPVQTRRAAGALSPPGCALVRPACAAAWPRLPPTVRAGRGARAWLAAPGPVWWASLRTICRDRSTTLPLLLPLPPAGTQHQPIAGPAHPRLKTSPPMRVHHPPTISWACGTTSSTSPARSASAGASMAPESASRSAWALPTTRAARPAASSVGRRIAAGWQADDTGHVAGARARARAKAGKGQDACSSLQEQLPRSAMQQAGGAARQRQSSQTRQRIPAMVSGRGMPIATSFRPAGQLQAGRCKQMEPSKAFVVLQAALAPRQQAGSARGRTTAWPAAATVHAGLLATHRCCRHQS